MKLSYKYELTNNTGVPPRSPNKMPVHVPKMNVNVRLAWRQNNRAIERDAERFWINEQLLPKDADATERLGELCLAGYVGHELVALTTARIRHIDFLGVKLAMARVATAHAMRQKSLGLHMLAKSREHLEAWSAANPQEEVMGMGTITQTHAWDTRPPSHALGRDTRLAFIGWTANNEPMRVAWFAHGTFPRRRSNPLP